MSTQAQSAEAVNARGALTALFIAGLVAAAIGALIVGLQWPCSEIDSTMYELYDGCAPGETGSWTAAVFGFAAIGVGNWLMFIALVGLGRDARPPRRGPDGVEPRLAVALSQRC